MKRILFVQRPMDDDQFNMKVVECVTCEWYTTYVDELWTSNDRPESQAVCFNQVDLHAREKHKGTGRILRGWRA